MPITPWLPSVTKIKDGEDVSAAVVNPISSQHTQRAQHLYEKFQSLEGKSVLTAYDLPILPTAREYVGVNTVVFYDQETVSTVTSEGISPAKAAFTSNSTNTAGYSPARSSFSVGIVKSVADTKADVYIWGLVELSVDIDDPDNGLLQSTDINQDAPFTPGPLYLSRTEAGKLTFSPGGVAIYAGFAMNRRAFLLAPNVSEFNQFFASYKFNLLDRPAGTPVLSTGTWTITNTAVVSGDGGVNHVGWVPVSALVGGPLESLVPEGAKFFYNLPSNALIAEDTGVDSDSVLRAEQLELVKALPPNPTNITLVTVNGIIQPSRFEDPVAGIYSVTAVGIWWFDDVDGQQPWSSDITASIAVTFDAITNEVTIPFGEFEVGDAVRFITSSALPAELTTTATYYVAEVSTVGNDQVIKISLTAGGDAFNFSTNGSGCAIPQLYTWKFNNGTDEYRPRISLQFLKFNPALKESIVTSLRKYNNSSSAIRFYNPDKTKEATSGDLLARLMLNIQELASTSYTGVGVSNITYDETTGIVTKTTAPVINELSPGTGITITPRTVSGVPVPGSYVLSSSLNTQSGRVSYIEPDGAELIYYGLHSYLNMPPASTLPSSLIGKIVLPSAVPDSDMVLTLVTIGGSNLALNSSAKEVLYDFSYSVSKAGSTLSTGESPVSISFAIPNTTTAYAAKTCFNVGGLDTASTYNLPVAALKIPATAFTSGNCIVNFKLQRKTPGSNAYTGDIGFVDIYWRIG